MKRPNEDWPAAADLSHANLSISDDEHEHEHHPPTVSLDTGPFPAVPARPATTIASDGAKIGAGSLGVIAILGLIDKALSGTGMTATDVVDHLGPALGPLFSTYPIVVGMIFCAYLLFRHYRVEQAAYRRRDKRLQKVMVDFGHAIKDQILALRRDVSSFTSELAEVRKSVADQIGRAVGDVAKVATERADRTDGAIADLRRTVDKLSREAEILAERMMAVESHMGPPALPRPSRIQPHEVLEAVPRTIRRPGGRG